MVYCGKPSSACHACRQRKTRCDALPNGCTQCKRAKRQCPGYRVQSDLVFRDQSANVIKRAKAQERKRSVKSESPSSNASPAPDTDDSIILDSESQDGEDLELVVRGLPPMLSLQPEVENMATCYFNSNYSVGITVPGHGEFNSVTVSLIWDLMDPVLATSIKATSLASFGHHVRSDELAKSSRVEYTKALKMTNAALSSPSQVKKDSTLVSVILLGLYEMITGRNQKSMKDWAAHVRGSSALLKLRGVEQFESPIGRRIFIQAATSILTSCLQRDMKPPQHIIDMTRELEAMAADPRFPEYMRRGTRIFQTNLAFADFQYKVNRGIMSDLRTIVDTALELDAPFADLYANQPPDWSYVAYVDKDFDPDIVYNGRYHVHWDTWALALWNMIRLFRIMIHQHIRGALLKGLAMNPPIFTAAEDYAQLERSMNMIYQMQSDILSSVPQALGYVRKTSVWREATPESGVPASFEPVFSPAYFPPLSSPEPIVSSIAAICSATPSSSSSSSSSFSSFIYGSPPADNARTHVLTKSPSGPSSNAFALLWPLWYTGFMELATDDVRKYVMGNLRRIGNEMGIQQAFVLARTIETKTEPKVWQEDEK
ncbi:hypothetical protein BDY17DRAFT_304509 [Neohortaea acidophila]|uniref:Zn(2)-C6 fungal-type domain-containing protein n=1 Tax=Neohortaea acidophila TaxID=245834 RepID=A0A6A6PI76_9PEZI|nr:uncharacterized protein BDY17DRAFT_304509 [Neohortaea acidophila]KAF2479730.1 hypothetical protein BDY17DRAFT_304509 [Neohortaea acidophila]